MLPEHSAKHSCLSRTATRFARVVSVFLVLLEPNYGYPKPELGLLGTDLLICGIPVTKATARSPMHRQIFLLV